MEKILNDATRVSVFEVVGHALCVASDDGQRVHDRLSTALKGNRNVDLSFRNVTTLTPAFLNSAVGQLYGTFSEDQIRTLLRVEGMSLDDTILLERVVDTAKLYFKDPQRFEEAFREEMDDYDDGS